MIPYRVKQVLWALTARPISAEDSAIVDSILTPAERDLFDQFSDNDQNHSLRVVKLVSTQDRANLPLKKAALLHDIGKVKVGRLSVVDRSVAVALKKLTPAQSKSWGSLDLAQAKRHQVPSIVRAQHAAWGANMAQAAGADEQTVNLIRRHQDPEGFELKSEEDILLRILQAADNVC